MTAEDFNACIEKYWKVKKDLPDMRLGQYLMNCLKPHEACPNIFYEKDAKKAADKFWRKYGDKDMH